MSYIGTEPKDIRSFGRTKFDYTATQGQTAFTGADDDGKVLAFTVGQIEVYVNGILMDDSDFTTTGTGTVTLASAANLNDVVNVVSFETNIPDSNYVPASGGTFTGAVTVNGAFTSIGIDDNADANSITIDTSENVLINAADTDPQNLNASSNSGVAIRSDGRLHAGAWQQRAAAFGRGGTDGEIVTFRKDGATVASIGSAGDRPYFVADNGSSGGGFKMDSLRLMPTDRTGATSDNTYNLGHSSVRWKDLYLSGGAYIGGTGTANHLDDYETGTFQMSVAGVSGGARGSGIYVKVGNIVHFQWYSGGMTVTSATPVITGLPFTSTDPNNNAAYAGFIAYHNTYVSNANTGYINLNSTSLYFTALNSTGGPSINTGSNIYCMVAGSYHAA